MARQFLPPITREELDRTAPIAGPVYRPEAPSIYFQSILHMKEKACDAFVLRCLDASTRDPVKRSFLVQQCKDEFGMLMQEYLADIVDYARKWGGFESRREATDFVLKYKSMHALALSGLANDKIVKEEIPDTANVNGRRLYFVPVRDFLNAVINDKHPRFHALVIGGVRHAQRKEKRSATKYRYGAPKHAEGRTLRQDHRKTLHAHDPHIWPVGVHRPEYTGPGFEVAYMHLRKLMA